MKERGIAIVGIGGAGCAIIEQSVRGRPTGASRVAIDTDANALDGSQAATKLQIGVTHTHGLGTGGDVHLGRIAAGDEVEMLRDLFSGVELAILAVGLGGGTGTGGAPVVLEAAHDAGALTLCFATLPLDLEGVQRKRHAEKSLSALRDAAGALIVAPNERLFEEARSERFADCFRRADELVGDGIAAVCRMLALPGYLRLDFPALRQAIRRNRGTCTFGRGEARGEGRAQRAVEAVLNCPLLVKGAPVERAATVLVCIEADESLTLKEVGGIMETIAARAGKGAAVVMGTVLDSTCGDGISITAVVSEERAPGVEPAPGPEPAAETAEPPEAQAEAARSRRGRRGIKGHPQQRPLPLQQGRLGKFDGDRVPPTIFEKEDLDIPTFKRRGATIEQ